MVELTVADKQADRRSQVATAAMGLIAQQMPLDMGLDVVAIRML